MSYFAIKTKIVLSTFVFTPLLLATQHLAAQTTTQNGQYTLAGQCADVIASYVATSSSVTVDGQTTGTVNIALDPTHTSTTTWDFTNKTETWNLYLTINSSTIQALAGAPVPVHLTESGVLPTFNLATLGSLAWSGSHTGVVLGTADTSGTDSGTFNNSGGSNIDLALNQAGPLTGNTAFTVDGAAITYQSSMTIFAGTQTLFENSNFTIVSNSVPEANPLAIAALGVTSLGLIARRRRG
jgi:hypothetical protein